MVTLVLVLRHSIEKRSNTHINSVELTAYSKNEFLEWTGGLNGARLGCRSYRVCKYISDQRIPFSCGLLVMFHNRFIAICLRPQKPTSLILLLLMPHFCTDLYVQLETVR